MTLSSASGGSLAHSTVALIATRLAEMGSPGMANPGVLQLPCDREFAPLDISPPPRQLLTPDIAITYICLLVKDKFYGSGLVFRVRVGLLSRAMRYDMI